MHRITFYSLYDSHAHTVRNIIHVLGYVWRFGTCIEVAWGAYMDARYPWSTTAGGPLIRNLTTFKCYITFCSIPKSCHVPPSTLFTIHLFFFIAWCLIIWLSGHWNILFRLVLVLMVTEAEQRNTAIYKINKLLNTYRITMCHFFVAIQTFDVNIWHVQR